MIQSEPFLSKNTQRKFPFRDSSTMEFVEGGIIPNGLIAAVQVSTKYANREVYISQIFSLNNFLSITIRDNLTGAFLGVFAASITEDFQVINLTSFNSFTSGTLTIGYQNELALVQGIKSLSYSNGIIEGSLVFTFTPPLVEKLTNKSKEIFGNITFSLFNLSALVSSPTITLNVIDVDLILANGDVNSTTLNCATPTILAINTVTPDVAGNIDIFGVLPVVIDTSGGITINTSTFTKDDYCAGNFVLLPPTDSSSTYANFLTVTEPEWRGW